VGCPCGTRSQITILRHLQDQGLRLGAVVVLVSAQPMLIDSGIEWLPKLASFQTELKLQHSDGTAAKGINS